ncbi:MAG: SipW-dependent-type signal peptide-containing protein [Lachnospiraceae bacterium]|nr:SipW-dependent-type signal peptide-containing protein [Lachnospiraceae bacterium]
MSEKRFTLLALMCLFICLACAGGAFAYLTNTKTVTNTFSIGEVSIDLLEPDYPGNGSDETTDLTALQEVPKDPQIYNSGKNRIVAFLHVDIPMASVIVTDEAGRRQPEENRELLAFRTTDGTYNSVNDCWHLISTVYLDGNKQKTTQKEAVICRRLYGCENVIDVGKTTDSLFDAIRLINLVEGQLDGQTLEIPLFAYAIQAENITGLTTADMQSEVLTTEELANIWEVYFTQNNAGGENAVF